MKSSEIRNQFFDYFSKKGHSFIRSSSLVPKEDPTLLFNNAGMNQFKRILLGKEKPKDVRVYNSQKCVRVSGKHNDLEEVGLDNYHHTFFEMLGNWSFGDYYKKEAIEWAWELFTDIWKLDKQRLWVTVFKDDNEAYEIWRTCTDISSDRLLNFGEKENFWEMGDTGPCGPCSEIHYYRGDDISNQDSTGVNSSDDYWELWNLVFIQNNRLPNGTLEDLPMKHIDTGAGLERIAAVLQGKTSNYDTDLFQPIIKHQEQLLGVKYSENLIAHRAIADHIRMLTFSIADGVLPSNDGRGYVVRRILRRAARYGRSLGCSEPFLTDLVDSVVKLMGGSYNEIAEKHSHIKKVIKSEELSFNETLDRGIIQFENIIKSISGKILSGKDAFKLYDTFGFPLDLTVQMATEQGYEVDKKEFNKAMNEQKKKGRNKAKFKPNESIKWFQFKEAVNTEFVGYDKFSISTSINSFHQNESRVLLILEKTPFYGEQGGQVGDTGKIKGKDFELDVIDTIKDGNNHIHVCKFIKGNKITSQNIKAKIDVERRMNIKKNHTATHLLHKALKIVLGNHVQQAGSLVHPDYLRFDITHYQKISNEDLNTVEKIVNSEIQSNSKLDVSLKSFDEAKEEGAVAIFEEKYGDQVRVIKINNFSKELCGGTHVERTGEIGFFKIKEESSLANGVRRLVCVTGPESVNFIIKGFNSLYNLKSILNSNEDEMVERIQTLIESRKNLEKEIKKSLIDGNDSQILEIIKGAQKIGKYQIITHLFEANDINILKETGDRIRDSLESGVGILGSVIESKPAIVCVVTDDIKKKSFNANNIAKIIGKQIGGGGGGKSHIATAGGKDDINFDEFFIEISQTLTNLMEGEINDS